MGDLIALEREVEIYRNLLSKAELQETVDIDLAEEIAKFEISFEREMNANQEKLTEIIKRERYEDDKFQEDLDSRFREYIESGNSIRDAIDKYSSKATENLELRLSKLIKQEEFYLEYLELYIKRMELDLKKGFKIHKIRYESDEDYKWAMDYNRLMDEWEKQALEVYKTEPDEMYI
ncbi:MAG: hypothetical protein KAT28_01165 [Candidatus Aenigmarchaeota archaeon]|nr:hypothetical protein [Candidatus Aenigmarchaeota archaeon]